MLISARSFKCSFARAKLKFYRSFNTIYHRASNASSVLVCVQLLQSICLPVLLYSIEVLFPMKSVISVLNNVLDRTFYHIFGCTDPSDITVIRNTFNLTDVNIIHLDRYEQFYGNFSHANEWSDIIFYCNNNV